MNIPWEELAKEKGFELTGVGSIIYPLSQAGYIFKRDNIDIWLWELFEMEEKRDSRFACGIASSEEQAYRALADTAAIWTSHGVKLSELREENQGKREMEPRPIRFSVDK